MIHVSQRERGPWLCCGPASFAMIAAAAGACEPTLEAGHAIAAAAGYRHPSRTDPGRLARGLAAIFGLELEPIPPGDLARRLELGYAIALPVDVWRLPAELRRWTRRAAGGHVGVLSGVSAAGWGWYDPLAPVGWGGEIVDPAAMIGAAWQANTYGAPVGE